MRAAVITNGRLEVVERPVPEPGPGQALVRIRASSVNGADLAQIAGRYPAPADAPAADIPGLDAAGEVAAVGPGVSRVAVGDRVMAVTGGGGWAGFVALHESLLQPVPHDLEWPAAGVLPEALLTAHDALVTQAGLGAGEHLLVTGAAGGVGIAGVIIGGLCRARVTASVRDEARRRDLAQHLELAGYGAEVLAPGELGDRRLDVVLELVGGAGIGDHLAHLATRGRMQLIGVGAGARAEVDLMGLMSRRARIQGSTLRARPLEERALAAQRVVRHLLPVWPAQALPVMAVYPLSGVGEAVERFRAGSKLGKIAITMD